MPLEVCFAVWAGRRIWATLSWLQLGDKGWGLRWAEDRKGAQCHEGRPLLAWPLYPPSPLEGWGAWPEIRGPPASALKSGGAFSRQNNAASLKGWAAGDGCFSKHRASFAKQALIPRPRGPRCLLGGRRGMGALFIRKRGLGDSGTKPGTGLAWAVGGLGKRARARMAVGSVVCMSRASPSSAPTSQGISGSLIIQQLLLDF